MRREGCGAAPPTSRVLRIAARRPYGPPLTPEPLRPLGPALPAGGGLPGKLAPHPHHGLVVALPVPGGPTTVKTGLTAATATVLRYRSGRGRGQEWPHARRWLPAAHMVLDDRSQLFAFSSGAFLSEQIWLPGSRRLPRTPIAPLPVSATSYPVRPSESDSGSESRSARGVRRGGLAQSNRPPPSSFLLTVPPSNSAHRERRSWYPRSGTSSHLRCERKLRHRCRMPKLELHLVRRDDGVRPRSGTPGAPPERQRGCQATTGHPSRARTKTMRMARTKHSGRCHASRRPARRACSSVSHCRTWSSSCKKPASGPARRSMP
jgi:hypothetical protein